MVFRYCRGLFNTLVKDDLILCYFNYFCIARPQSAFVQQEEQCEKMEFSEENDTLLRLPNACWEKVFSYLYPKDQVSLSQTSKWMHQIFVEYASRHYAIINISSSEFIASNLREEYLEELLDSIGQHVKSYAAPRDVNYTFTMSEYKEYKKNKRYEKLQAVYRHGNHGIVNSFGLQLRIMYRRHFELVLLNCHNLERFEFGKRYLTKIVSYEKILMLPRLQHLFLWSAGELRTQFLEALEAKPGAPLLSLSIKGLPVPKEQVKRICGVTSLKELCISCKEVPLNDLLRLKQLECLHITMPRITNSELKTLVKGLPHLHTLDLRKCPLITERFVIKVLKWMNKTENLRQHLRIYLQGSSVHCKRLTKLNDNRFIEVIKLEKHQLVLMEQELSQEYQ